MSPQTKKLKKEKNRLKRQEEARSPLYRFLDQHPVILELSPKQLLACIRISRALPKMNKSTAELVIKPFIYYVHERLWYKHIKYGIK